MRRCGTDKWKFSEVKREIFLTIQARFETATAGSNRDGNRQKPLFSAIPYVDPDFRLRLKSGLARENRQSPLLPGKYDNTLEPRLRFAYNKMDNFGPDGRRSSFL